MKISAIRVGDVKNTPIRIFLLLKLNTQDSRKILTSLGEDAYVGNLTGSLNVCEPVESIKVNTLTSNDPAL